MFCCSNVPETNSQSGCVASASSVRQTPPFDAAYHIVQAPGTQSGEITAATPRPLKFSVPAV